MAQGIGEITFEELSPELQALIGSGGGGGLVIESMITQSVEATQDNQQVFTIPFPTYDPQNCYMDIRIHSTWINPDRYVIRGNEVIFNGTVDKGVKVYFTIYHLGAGSGSGTVNEIEASKVIETTDKQFVTQEEKDKISSVDGIKNKLDSIKVPEKATESDAVAGLDDEKYMTPKLTKDIVKDASASLSTSLATKADKTYVDDKFKIMGVTYTDISQIGLSDNDFSVTDVLGNFDKIITAMQNFSSITIKIHKSINPSLTESITNKLLEDTGHKFTLDSIDGNLWITKQHTTNVSNPIRFYQNTYNMEYRSFFDKDGTTPKLSAFQVVMGSEEVSNPNLLINPQFTVWQDGTTFALSAGTNAYTADCWYARCLSSVVFPTGVTSSSVAKSSRGIRLDNHTNLTLSQYIEKDHATPLVGKVLTLSFEVACQYDTKVRLQIVGCSTTYKTANDITVTGGDVKRKINASFVINSITTSTHPYIEIKFLDSANSGWFDIISAKLEVGAIATMHTLSNYTEEFLKCQRYFQKGMFHQDAMVCDNTQLMYTIQMPVPMRVTPTFKAITDIYAHYTDSQSGTLLLRNEGWTKNVGVVMCNQATIWIYNETTAPSEIAHGAMFTINSSGATNNRLSDPAKYSLDARIY